MPGSFTRWTSSIWKLFLSLDKLNAEGVLMKLINMNVLNKVFGKLTENVWTEPEIPIREILLLYSDIWDKLFSISGNVSIHLWWLIFHKFLFKWKQMSNN